MTPASDCYQPPIRSSLAPGPWATAGWAMLAVGIGASLFAPVRQLADTTLDNSNFASYAYFTAKGSQYGTEVLPMAGPFGFVPYGFLYAGFLFWKRFPLELLTKLVAGILCVWLVRRNRGWIRWTWLAAVILMAPLVEDLPYDLAVLLAGLCLLERMESRAWSDHLVGAGLAGYLALLTLFKGTQMMLAAGTLLLVVLLGLQLRHWRRLGWILAAYFGSLCGLWLAAGQHPANFPSYVRSVLELSSGYNAAMALEEPRAAFLSGLGALLTLLGLILGLLWRARRPATLAGGALLLAFAFVEWKHGFVRADGHVYIFFQYVVIAVPLAWLCLTPAEAIPRRPAVIAVLLSLSALSFGIWSDGQQALARHLWTLRQVPGQVCESLRQIVRPASTKARLDRELALRRSLHDLPLVRSTVGMASVDFYGTELGFLLQNRLNYRPRPMGGGSFNVFTPWLQGRNEAWLSSPATRPEFYLVNLQTIDHRLLTQDDPDTLRHLLADYAPVATEQGLVLLQARPPAPNSVEPRLLESREIRLGEPIAVPQPGVGEMIYCTLELPLSLSGRLRGLLYKPALMFLDLEGTGLAEPANLRIIPDMCAHPVLLNPALESTADLLELYSGTAGKRVRHLVLHTVHPECFQLSGLRIHFYAGPRPEVTRDAPRLAALLRFPVANTLPTAMEPANAPLRRFDGQLVQMLEPPGRIQFALRGTEREVRFRYGIDPEAYAPGRTDGVEFFVEIARPGQSPQLLFRRWLRPRTVLADRGVQEARVILPPMVAGADLILRTGPGADQDAAWDWGYFTGIRLLGGGYLPEQFPRFGTLPESVDAVIAGLMPYDGRELFMLNSPGTLEFKLHGSERELRFKAGLLPGAYSRGGNSDGVEFQVKLRTPDGHIRTLATLPLNPRDNPEQRGDRPFMVSLPTGLPSGTRLQLYVSPGPAGDTSWDWSYLESLELN